MRSLALLPLISWVIALLVGIPLAQADEDPFDMPPVPAKGAPATKTASAADKGDESGWSSSTIPVSHSDGVVFGPPGCPVVLAGTRVVEIASSKVRMEVERDFSGLRMAAFSDNGQYLATGWKANDGSGKISVYDTIKGEKVCDIPQTQTAKLSLRHRATNT